MKLHSRIFLLLMSILLGLEGASIALMYRSARSNVDTETGQRLQTAQRTFADSLKNQQTFLSQNVVTVARDWGLRQAIGQRDVETLNSVLENHSGRIGADIAIFVDNDGVVMASTRRAVDGLPGDLQTLLAGKPSEFLGVVRLDDTYYQLVLVQVMAPLSVGWIGMGFAVDDALARHHSQITGVDISFVETTVQGLHFVASTLDEARQRTMAASGIIPRGIGRARAEGWEDLVLHDTLGTHAAGLGVLLQSSLDKPLENFRSWWLSLFSIYLVITLLALCLGYVFARGITRPLQALMRAAGDIARGDYSTALDSSRSDEIGVLSTSFARMQEAISEREDEIQYRAHHDAVTGTLNRAGFLHRVQEEISSPDSSGKHLVVACCALEHFTEINDALGHQWGDKLLALVASRLQQRLDENGIASLNSSEFCLLIDTECITHAYQLAEQIHQCFTDEFNIRGISLSISVSVGMAAYPDNAPDAQSLLRLASVALNEARQSRAATVVYDPALDRNSIKRLTLMSELPTALKNGHLQLYYQPQVRAQGGRRILHGVECLVRWNHPELGFVPPDEFIGLAERTGYIVELTQWVLDQALAQCAQWRKQKLSLGIAVNISALDLQREGFDQLLVDLLDAYRVPAGVLTLEVTESAAMRDPDAAIGRLGKLSKLGVRLAIDDFGTGHSSLAHLKRMPVDELKIDKSFVMELDRNEDDGIIVHSTIELGHNMGLELVAEGVENARIAWQLEQWGCDTLQGFHIARPFPAVEFGPWLKNSDCQVETVAVPVRTSLVDPRARTLNSRG
jgi:diguanylate cyclase (GGDEF)-like protein